MAARAEREALLAGAHRREVVHETGHAVAAVARGGTILEFVVPFGVFEGEPENVGQPLVNHHTGPEHRPFVTYAGL